MISPALLGAAVRSGQDGIHLRLVQIGEFVPCESLEWDGSYLAAPGNMFGTAFGDESRHRVNGRETLVAGADGASSVLFEMIEEASQHLTRHVRDIEPIHRPVPLS